MLPIQLMEAFSLRGFKWTRVRVAGAVGGVVLAAGVAVAGGQLLSAGPASAQSPSPSPSPAASPAPSPEQGQSGRRPGIGQMKHDLAARIAGALNIPQDRVEQAFEQLRDRARQQAVERLAPAATELGVTPQELADAMRAAHESLHQDRTPGRRLDRSAYYDSIAQQLGRGITGDQVQSALESLRQIARQDRPDRQQLDQRLDQFLQEIAGLLGVSVDQLREAMQNLRGSWMHGPRGR